MNEVASLSKRHGIITLCTSSLVDASARGNDARARAVRAATSAPASAAQAVQGASGLQALSEAERTPADVEAVGVVVTPWEARSRARASNLKGSRVWKQDSAFWHDSPRRGCWRRPQGDAATGAPLAVLRAATTARNDINGVAWSPDGRLIAAAGQDGYVRIWDPVAKSEVRNLKAGPSWTRGVSWSLDGKVLATSGAMGRLFLWDPETGNLLATLSDKGPDIWSVAFSPDGTRLASGSGGYEVKAGVGAIRLWGAP